ncbi:hypothetical protein BSL78_07649 [Apostichopus japonicus]|uniref:Uncharacterized protein n=1 Tax=Stichopus japonicus TaxID=307972 RepID=A0A2G8L5D6_STIJA|nr:hypothetical protein BSL78_07649 [Apostichopus japonicus]
MYAYYNSLRFVSPSTASLCLIFPSQVQITLSFPTTNLPQPSPSGTYGIQDEDFILDGHAMLHNFVSTLHGLHRHIFAEYKVSRFSNIDATCSGSFKVEGLPLHHELPETYDLAEADLLRTHQRFVEEYIKVMKAAIDDELLYEKSDNFVLTRDEDERFSVIKNWFERVYAALTQQIDIEGYQNTGIVLLRMEGSFHFAAHPDESFRNIRVLCVLEDINRYLPRLLADATIMKNVHS